MKALVLGGGGSFCAYQVGVLKALSNAGHEGWDLYCGSSGGGLNAAYLAQYKRVVTAVTSLEKLWLRTETEHVHKPWPLGYLEGLWRRGLRNTTPLKALINENFNPKHVLGANKKLRVVAVSLQTYEAKIWNENSPDIKQGLLASAAIPFFFSSVKIEGQYWADGMLRSTAALSTAIDEGATTVDVILTRSKIKTKPLGPPVNAFNSGTRCLEIMIDDAARMSAKLAMAYTDLLECGGGATTADKRRVNIRLFEPTQPFDSNPLTFDPKTTERIIAMGYEDAQAVING